MARRTLAAAEKETKTIKTSTRRNANKIADIANDALARIDQTDAEVEAGNQPSAIRPTFDELVQALRDIEVIATKMHAGTGTTDEAFAKNHRRQAGRTNLKHSR